MSKICGIIAEYNPFHNGHAYQIEQARRISAADAIVVVMSGNFVQRGEPAIVDKFVRTRAALLGGADLVLELPTAFATRSAEAFALGATYILAKTGIVDSICFGAETADIPALQAIARHLVYESDSFKHILKEGLSSGLSFPKSRALALIASLGHEIPKTEEIISAPNNILGIEYLKAIERYKLPLVPYAISRKGAEHHSKNLEGSFASASALRREIHAGNLDLSAFMPASSLALIKNEHINGAINHIDNFSTFLHYIATTNFIDAKLQKAAAENFLISDIVAQAKTKNITHTALKRAALHSILQPTFHELPKYIRILGFKKSHTQLVQKLHKNAALPVVSNLKYSQEIMQEEINNTKLYWLGLKHKNIKPRCEFSSPMVKI